MDSIPDISTIIVKVEDLKHYFYFVVNKFQMYPFHL